MEQNELLQDLALKLDLANMELQTIDEVLARRPALDGLKHRTEKIERACQANGDLLKVLEAARHCIKSYQHGNAATDLAKEMAEKIEEVLKKNGVEIQF